jgi:hypothetical protein
LTALAAAGLVMLAATPPSTAQPIGADSASTAQCSGTLLFSVSESVLPQGSTAYKYDLPDGTSFVNVAPPAGFTIMTASNALLTELGLPPRPTAAADLQSWETQVAPFSKSAIDGTETFCEPTAPIAPAPAGSVGHTGNTIWSGYEAQNPPYQKAVGHFEQPLVTVSGTSLMSNWVGIRGTGNGGRLIQAGTENTPDTPTVGSLFWENYCFAYPHDGCNGPQLTGPNASPGDDISVSVSWNPLTNISYYAVAVNGTEELNVQYGDWPGSYSGDVADFITERNAGFSLPDFGVEQFSNSRTYTAWNGSSYVWLGAQNYYAWEATEDGSFHNPP